MCYRAPRVGCYQLQINVEGHHNQGSPFITTAVKLTTPINIIGGLKWPCGVAISKDGEYLRHRISIFSASGNKITSFSKQGSDRGDLDKPQGVIFNGNANIPIADNGSNRFQNFSMQGKHAPHYSGKKTTNALEFTSPSRVKVHPLNNRTYITESCDNHRVQVLDDHLNHIAMFGSEGSDSGNFKYP